MLAIRALSARLPRPALRLSAAAFPQRLAFSTSTTSGGDDDEMAEALAAADISVISSVPISQVRMELLLLR